MRHDVGRSNEFIRVRILLKIGGAVHPRKAARRSERIPSTVSVLGGPDQCRRELTKLAAMSGLIENSMWVKVILVA